MLFLMGALVCSLPVQAHRFHAAFTQIDIQEEKKTLEITHRLFTHDVRDLLALTRGGTLDETEIESALKHLIQQNFALFDAGHRRLALTWIGMEYHTDTVYLYQEAALPADLSVFQVTNRLLMDLFTAQKNTVNIAWGDKRDTVILTKDTPQQVLRPGG